MPRPRAVPAYRKHSSGQARATFGGETVYFGTYNSPESKRLYEQHLARWLARDRQPAPPASERPTVTVLMAAYLTWRDSRGFPKTERQHLIRALKPVRALFGALPVAEFTPACLLIIAGELVRTGICRRLVRMQLGRVKNVFAWGVLHGFVTGNQMHALREVQGKALSPYLADAPEHPKSTVVSDEQFAAVLPLVTRPVRALLELLRCTGMRPGEAVIMRRRDVIEEKGGLFYTPTRHKTQYRGKRRVIPLGPKAQTVLAPWLDVSPDSYLFRPTEAGKPGARGARKPGPCYTVSSLAHAVVRACDAAFPPPEKLRRLKVKAGGRKATRWELVREWRERLGPEGWAELEAWRATHRWHPHLLRHTFNTEARLKFGPDFARAALGQSSIEVNNLYDHGDLEKARKVMEELG